VRAMPCCISRDRTRYKPRAPVLTLQSMLSIGSTAQAQSALRSAGPKQTRSRQRALPLFAGLVVVVYVYAAPELGQAAAAGVRWLVLPILIASGVVMWQWPRLRVAARRRKATR
jgi:hypothetical protein